MSADIHHSQPAESPEESRAFRQVSSMLDQGRAREAAELLAHAKNLGDSVRVKNANGVCLLRMGEAERAVQLFRGMAVSGKGISLREDLPATILVNYATALYLTQRVAGCEAVLAQLGDESNPAVQRLRAAIGQWERGLSFWQRLHRKLGGEPESATALDYPPGDLL